MKIATLLATGLGAFVAMGAGNTTLAGVKISEKFGYDPVDATANVQAALDSGEKNLILDRQSGDWIVRPLSLTGRDGLTLTFEEGAFLVAKRGEFHGRNDTVLKITTSTNIVLRGTSPKSCGIRMWFEDYYNPDKTKPNAKGYAWSEWRHGISLLSCANITIDGLSSNSTGGDGLYVSTGGSQRQSCANVTVRNCIFDGNNRQGISVIGARGFVVEDTILSNTRGTNPMAGIDFEPNNPHEAITGVVMRRCKAINNKGAGFEFYLGKLNRDSAPLNALFEDCVAIGNANNFSFSAGSASFEPYNYDCIELRRCRFEGAERHGIRFSDRPFDQGTFLVRDTLLKDNATLGTNYCEMTLSVIGHGEYEPNVYAFTNVTVVRSQPGRILNNPKRIRPFCGKPSVFTGSIDTIVAGKRETVVFDDAWNKAYHPYDEFKGKNLKRFSPSTEGVTIIDECPNKMVEIKVPIFSREDNQTVTFYADCAKTVHFKIQQTIIGKRTYNSPKKPMAVKSVATGIYLKQKVKVPVDPDGAIVSFKVPKKGFYTMSLPSGGNGVAILATDVPVAYEIGFNYGGFVGPKGKSAKNRKSGARLYFEVAKGADFAVMPVGYGVEALGLEIIDPNGQVVERDTAISDFTSFLTEKAEGGLWSLRIFPPSAGVFEDYSLSVAGIPGWMFLTPEKRWN